MKIKLTNNGLLNIIKPFGINKKYIKSIKIGESHIIIELSSKDAIILSYKV